MLTGASALADQVLDHNDDERVDILENLAIVEDSLGHNEEAISAERDVVAILRATVGDDNPRTALAMGSLGGLLSTQAHLAESEEFLRSAQNTIVKYLGRDSPDAIDNAVRLSNTLMGEVSRR